MARPRQPNKAHIQLKANEQSLATSMNGQCTNHLHSQWRTYSISSAFETERRHGRSKSESKGRHQWACHTWHLTKNWDKKQFHIWKKQKNSKLNGDLKHLTEQVRVFGIIISPCSVNIKTSSTDWAPKVKQAWKLQLKQTQGQIYDHSKAEQLAGKSKRRLACKAQ